MRLEKERIGSVSGVISKVDFNARKVSCVIEAYEI